MDTVNVVDMIVDLYRLGYTVAEIAQCMKLDPDHVLDVVTSADSRKMH